MKSVDLDLARGAALEFGHFGVDKFEFEARIRRPAGPALNRPDRKVGTWLTHLN